MNNFIRFYWLLIGLVLLSATSAICQDYPMIHFTVDDGLPSNTIYNSYRDSKGFIWIATDKGIARYNGIKFTVYTTFNGLPDNEILFFMEDYQERLWLGTYSGELCYYKNDTFHTAANTPFLKLSSFKPGSYIRNIFLEKDSSVSIDYSAGKTFVNIKNDTKRLFVMDTFLKDQPIIFFLSKVSDNEYNVVFKGLTVVIDSNMRIKSKNKNQYVELSAFYQNKDRYYLLSNNMFVSNRNDTFRRSGNFHLKTNKFYNIYNDGQQIFYLTTGGLFFYDSVMVFNEKVATMQQDIKGNYWLGTVDKGIYVLDKDFRNTRLYTNAYSGKVKYSRRNDGNLYFASEKDLRLLNDKKIKEVVDFKRDLGKCSGNSFELATYFITRGNQFYCFNKNHLYLLDLNDKLKPVAVKSTFAPDYLKALFATNEVIYLCTHNQLYSLNQSEIIRKDTFTAENLKINGGRIFSAMLKSEDTSIWFSTLDDLYRIDKYGKMSLIKSISFKSFSFIGNYLVGYTHKNNLLLCKDITGKAVIDTIAKDENCIWDKFYSLDPTHLLISTNNLYRVLTISPTGVEAPYSISSIENDFVPLHADAICADSENYYFFKDSSIISLNIREMTGKSQPPKLFFTFLKAHKTYAISDKVELPYNDSKSIIIHFNTLSFYGKKVNYQYSLSKNEQDNWSVTDGDELRLTNPGYGTFYIKIRASTSSSIPGEPIVFKLIIKTPYWATGWFLVLSAGLICLVLILIIYITRVLVLNVARRKHQHTELELKSIYSQLNPHFIFNSLNAAMYLIKTKRLEDAYQHIYKFSRLLRSYIKSSRNRFIRLSDEIENLKNYIELQQARFNDKFDYEIITLPGVDTNTDIPSLLIQPLVENAIAHGLLNKEQKGKLKIEFASGIDGKLLICSIDDDGIGREQSLLNKDENQLKEESYGGKLITSLIEVMNKSGKVNIDLGYFDKLPPQTGTTVVLKIKQIN